ncbi:GATA zinc finger [Seiridium cupressi]
MATLPPTPTPTMATNHESTQPVCQNCQTSTTPLWRRDEMGSVLCNACGLFLKLHGRPRPISLKTDVIKSRNRVKTVRPDMQMKKKSLPATAVDPNGLSMHAHDAATAAALAVRRTSQHKVNGHPDDSPVSRTGTPSMYDPSLAMYTNGVDGHHYQSPALPQYPMPAGGSPGHDPSSANGEAHGDVPETREQLIAANSSLKTRVSELEVINELYRGRLTQLEADSQNADNFRHQAEEAMKAEAHERQLREDQQRKLDDTQRQLDDSHRRENIFKRRLDEMEQELKDAHDKIKQLEEAESERPAKKPRLEEETKKEESEAAPTPQSTS